MKKIILSILLTAASLAHLFAFGKKENDTKIKTEKDYQSDLPAYVIYNKDGEQITYHEMIEGLLEAEVCLFGELHNDPISHWLEKRVLISLHEAKGQELVVGAEMFETDNQLLLDELQAGLIDGNTYIQSSKLWPNMNTDYLPLIQYAKKNDLRFIATNTPRRYANIIYKKGIEYLDSLSSQAKSYLPPYPIHFNLEEKIYKDMGRVFPTDEEWEKQRAAGKTGKTAMSNGRPSNLVKAQAIKDATMAWFIVKNLQKGQYFYHFHGEMHSANHSAICYYLNYYRPSLKYKSISMIRQQNPLEFGKNTNRADYNIVIPSDMAVTYNAGLL